jgi:hypothetical protein
MSIFSLATACGRFTSRNALASPFVTGLRPASYATLNPRLDVPCSAWSAEA